MERPVGDRRGAGEETDERSSDETDREGECDNVAIGGGVGLLYE
jgi:hypothetical protein